MSRKPPPIPPPDHPSARMQDRIDRLVENSQPRATIRPAPIEQDAEAIGVYLGETDAERIRLGTDDLMARAAVIEVSADEHTHLVQDRAALARARVAARAVASVLRRMAEALDALSKP